MFHVDSNDFGFSVDNFGATFTEAAFGTSATSGAAHTKGTAVELIPASSITTDIYEVMICFCGGFSSANVRRFLADILVDPAGGTAWSVLIPNLLMYSPSLNQGGFWFKFPIFIKSGSSVGFQHQCSTTTIALRCGIRLYGKPTNPAMMRVGTKVEAIGVSTGSTDGTTVVPGNAAMGSYSASLGTTSRGCWCWELGLGTGDSALSVNTLIFEAAAGDATNKLTCIDSVMVRQSSAEESGKFPVRGNFRDTKAGESVYARAAGMVAPDSPTTIAVYGVS